MIEKADALITEIQEMGGMTIAVQEGLPKREIEKMATARQARIDSGAQVIVGVNKFTPEDDIAVNVLEIDNDAVREKQMAALQSIRERRDDDAVTAALAAISTAATTQTGNLLSLAIDAMRVRATVGEV